MSQSVYFENQPKQQQHPNDNEVNNNINNNSNSKPKMSHSLRGEARFELKRQLADTLQGRIYSAIDRCTGEWVVVKETWKQLVKLGKSRDGHNVPENFFEEKKILKYLSNQKDCNDGFVKLIDEWEDNDCYLYAMEMCGGGELFEYIKNIHSAGFMSHFTRSQIHLKQELIQDNDSNNVINNKWIIAVKHMFRELVNCVNWMHEKGVCHLDLSLENTMIAVLNKNHLNKVKIIDFGLGRYYANKKFLYNKRIGKTGYMSPEVYNRQEYDPRSADIWSLGVMLFMMLIGAPPYQIPHHTNPAFNFIVNGRLYDVLKHWKRLRLVTKNALDLMNKIFKYEKDRITMDQILQHPFVTIMDEKNNNNNNNNTVNNNNNVIIDKEKEKEKEKEHQNQNQNQSQTHQTHQSHQPQQQQPNKTEIEKEKEKETEKEIETEKEKENIAIFEKKAQMNGNGNDANLMKRVWKSDAAEKFAKQLSNDLNRDQLKSIMKEVQKEHHKFSKNSNKDPNKNTVTINELTIIQNSVVQRLENCDDIQKKAHLDDTRHAPSHNN